MKAGLSLWPRVASAHEDRAKDCSGGGGAGARWLVTVVVGWWWLVTVGGGWGWRLVAVDGG